MAVGAVPCAGAEDHGMWIPRGIETLRQNASSKTDFTLDHSMLVIASKLEPDNADLRRVIAGVSGLSIHKYRFPESWQEEPAVLNSMKEEYRAAGWKKLVDTQGKNGGTVATEVWVRLENNAVSDVALLFARSNQAGANQAGQAGANQAGANSPSSEVTFVTVSGSISPADLSHLGGHFGIPQIEGGVLVPNPERQP